MISPHGARHILYIEDSYEDLKLLLRTFEKCGFDVPIRVCENGDKALEYLLHQPMGQQDLSWPSLILLDLNLPGTDGREVLRQLKSAPGLREIPVVVLTSSNDERDVRDCYDKGANTYVVKPLNTEEFRVACERIRQFWFEVATLPPH